MYIKNIMGYLFQDSGKQKKAKYKANTKKWGNFLGNVGELVSPTGWEGFATAAGLLAIDRVDAALRRDKSENKSVKGSAKKGGQSIRSKKTSSKKSGNFLGAVGELVAPSGWETFATTAGLFALDRADSALRREKSKKRSVKKGGMNGGAINIPKNTSRIKDLTDELNELKSHGILNKSNDYENYIKNQRIKRKNN